MSKKEAVNLINEYYNIIESNNKLSKEQVNRLKEIDLILMDYFNV